MGGVGGLVAIFGQGLWIRQLEARSRSARRVGAQVPEIQMDASEKYSVLVSQICYLPGSGKAERVT